MSPRWRAKALPKLSPRPSTLEHALAALSTSALPLLLVRDALRPGNFPGQPMGESWGHLFAIGQVSRWWTGQAAPWRADLLAFPGAAPFWPVDPTITLPASVAALAIGPALALTLATFGLLWIAGWGPWRLCRTLGAPPIAALIAAVVVQTQPFLLRNAEDGLLDTLGIGVAALACNAMLVAWRSPNRLNRAKVAIAVTLLGGTSPYLTVYLLIGWAFLALVPAIRRPLRPYLRLSFPIVVGAIVSATPLLFFESGAHGRLNYEGGYSLRPHILVAESAGETVELRSAPRPAPLQALADLPTPRAGQPAPGAVQRLLVRFPGGIACWVGFLFGASSRRGRRWSVLALGFFLLGPGPLLVARTLGLAEPAWMPLQAALTALPFGDALGNPQRMVLAFGMLAALAGALGTMNRPLRLAGWAAAAIASIALTQPGLALSTSHLDPGLASLPSAEGAVITFPSGDPPIWNPGVPAKLDLALATVHKRPVAYDYGRGRARADARFLGDLSVASAVPVGREALARPEAEGEIQTLYRQGFRSVLVVDALLEAPDAKRAHLWLEARLGPPTRSSKVHTVYAIPRERPLSP